MRQKKSRQTVLDQAEQPPHSAVSRKFAVEALKGRGFEPRHTRAFESSFSP